MIGRQTRNELYNFQLVRAKRPMIEAAMIFSFPPVALDQHGNVLWYPPLLKELDVLTEKLRAARAHSALQFACCTRMRIRYTSDR